MSQIKLSDRQYEILEFIFDQISMVGRPPTIREICNHFGFASPRSASDHLKALEKKGYIERTKSPRGIQLAYDKVWELFGISIVAEIDAESPQLAQARFVGTLTPSDLYPVDRDLYALRMPDDGMAEAGIFRDDLVILREQSEVTPNKPVLVLIDGALTVRTLREGINGAFLEAGDPDIPPVPAPDTQILGEAVRVVRDL